MGEDAATEKIQEKTQTGAPASKNDRPAASENPANVPLKTHPREAPRARRKPKPANDVDEIIKGIGHIFSKMSSMRGKTFILRKDIKCI